MTGYCGLDENKDYALDENKKPEVIADPAEWVRRFKMDDDRITAYDEVEESGISTVFIGSCGIYWETRVFGGKLEGQLVRYCSHEEALKGHKEMVRRVEDA